MKPESNRDRPMKTTRSRSTNTPAILLDLDGTLVDTVYQHVAA
jgi:trehalose-6-phosphatase